MECAINEDILYSTVDLECSSRESEIQFYIFVDIVVSWKANCCWFSYWKEEEQMEALVFIWWENQLDVEFGT